MTTLKRNHRYTDFCCVSGCNEEFYAKGYCNYHYLQHRKFGDIGNVNEIYNELTSSPNRLQSVRLCSVDGCNKKHFGNGYCSKHYYHIRKHGEIGLVNERSREHTVCTVDGCNEKHHGNGYCKKHYHRHYYHMKNGSNYQELVKKREGREKCSVDGCDRVSFYNNMCRKHYKENIKPREVRLCTANGCSEKHYGKGYCKRHYKQFTTHGRIIN